MRTILVATLLFIAASAANGAVPQPDEPSLPSATLTAIMEKTVRPADSAIMPQGIAAARKRLTSDGECPDLTGLTIDRLAIATLDPVVESTIMARKIRNAWTASAKPVGCKLPTANVLLIIFQQNDDSYTAITYGRGESLAWPQLAFDARQIAAKSAFAACALQGCQSTDAISLLPTRIDGQPSNLGPVIYGIRARGEWTEIWPIKVGNFPATDVLVKFTADGQGGANVDASVKLRAP